MTVGIWTPVAGSTQQTAFPDRLNNFAAKVKQVTLVAGTHMMFRVIGCLPVYICTTQPTTDAEGLTGTPVSEDVEYVMPRVSPVWIYSPYENSTVLSSVGAMT